MSSIALDETIYEFNALITYCRYYSDQTSWGCYGFFTMDDIPHFIQQSANPFDDAYGTSKSEMKDKKKFSTIVGQMQELTIGGEYLVKATFKKDPRYGDQYVVKSVYALIPQSEETQLLFLKSLIPESTAENLLKAYPNIVNDIANGTLDKIDYSKVKGVREITWNRIKEKIISNYLISDIITMLKPLGVTFNMIKKLMDDEPNPALLKKQIEDNPYTLTRIDGIGWKKCDSLALKLKPSLIDSHERLVAYVTYVLKELGESDGHTWVYEDELRKAVSNNLPECASKFDWLLENSDFLHIDDSKVGLKYYYDTEMDILSRLKKKAYGKPIGKEIDEALVEQAIKEAETEQGFTYVEEQLQAIKNAIRSNVSIITGKAGTGKSSIMRAIIRYYKLTHQNIVASALSAQAAQRITEATGYPAMTIHRTLGAKGLNKFEHNEHNPLRADVAFLDEGSMVNASIMLSWLKAIDYDTKIIIAGDHKQLPPIGYGNAFSDLIHIMEKSIVNKLNKPMRQAQKSGILVDANLIRDNKNPITETISSKLVHGELQDMVYMFRSNRQSLADIAIKTFLSSIETDGLDNVVIITPRRQGCLNSSEELNKVIQEKLLGDVLEEIEGSKFKFKLGAKVLQTVNDYDNNVFNGEVGYITRIFTATVDKKEVPCAEVTFNDLITGKKLIVYTQKDLVALDLAYAMTVHKCQGIGKKTVIGIVDNTHYQLLDNCMLYTLLTRAKKRCLLLAEPQAFSRSIRQSHNDRKTWMILERGKRKENSSSNTVENLKQNEEKRE